MSILTTDLRNKRNQFVYTPTYRTVAHYCTDTTKFTEMKDSLRDDFFFNSIRPLPDLLKKNLADTLVNQQTEKSEMASPKEPKVNDYSKLSGLTNFISGVFSVVSSVMFRRPKSPVDCFDNDQMAHSGNWHYSNMDYKSELGPSVDVCKLNVSGLCDCNTVSCEDKPNKVRQPLPSRHTQHQTVAWLRCPKNQFTETNFVEDCFEDALSIEECFRLPGNPFIEYFSPSQYQKHEFHEIDSPKTKIEDKLMRESVTLVKNSPKITLESQKKYPDVQELNSLEDSNKLVESCEDKVLKLKAYLQQRCRNKTKALLETDSAELKPTKAIPITSSKSKRFKNPNRLCSKRVKTNMKQIIEDEMLFANEVNLDDFSSVEDSPSFHSLEKWSESPQSNDARLDYFDEICGRFQTGSAVSSEDSFQIVFTDVPKRVRSTSECDSEDSFIVFEDSPDSCYTSNDVFCDSDDDDSDSDSDMSDSGCGNMKLSQSLSRTVSNLTDESLYDEVDSANGVQSSIVLHKGESKSGLLTEEHKKSAKTELPVKKVRFSPLPPKVHVMHVWAFAARQARAGHWEQYALDRDRFRRRIADAEMALAWVLKPQHRSRVMFQRFMPWWNAQKRKELAEKSEKNEAEKARRESEEKELNVGVVEKETQEINEKHGNEETLGRTQDKELKTDYKEADSFQLKEDSKQRVIIRNNTNNTQTEEEDTIQKKRKEGESKSHQYILDDIENLHTKVENKLLHTQDRDEHGVNIVRDADKRILKSNGI